MKQINRFWKWFQDNELAIKHAFTLGINSEEVISHLLRNLDYVSKRIGYVVKIPKNEEKKCLIIFTGGGYRKLFPKLVALEEQAPALKYFKPQAFIKPLENIQEIKNDTANTLMSNNREITIIHLQFSLLDFNIATKQLKIAIYVPNDVEMGSQEEQYNNMKYVLMEIIGELNYRKHIKYFEIIATAKNPVGLLDLLDLQVYIDYLYKINSRKKPRMI